MEAGRADAGGRLRHHGAGLHRLLRHAVVGLAAGHALRAARAAPPHPRAARSAAAADRRAARGRLMMPDELALSLWHGLPTVPPGRPKVSTPSQKEGDLRSGPWHGRETVPQRKFAERSDDAV